jgi:hypothetical protein
MTVKSYIEDGSYVRTSSRPSRVEKSLLPQTYYYVQYVSSSVAGFVRERKGGGRKRDRNE